MNDTVIHNPDRFMMELRQILSQAKKRIGLLVGAGAPCSMRVDDTGQLSNMGRPLIPDVETLTKVVIENLSPSDQQTVALLKSDLPTSPTIETILTAIRRLSLAIGSACVHNTDGAGYERLAHHICKLIGENVAKVLPNDPNPYTELVSWIGGIRRDHPVEIFTPNYDLLIEEAFERSKLPYFDGFTGSHKPFFDASSINDPNLTSRWSRLWKIHGSLGWAVHNDTIIRTGQRQDTRLIYPDHLKYDEINRLPYSALFDRLRTFLMTPDSLLICTGFSFRDAHITAVIDEALSSNAHTAVLAFQFSELANEQNATKVAMRRPNLSIYAPDGAVIFGIQGMWKPGTPLNDNWESIRNTFWDRDSCEPGRLRLGDFAKLARFFSLAQADQLTSEDSASHSDVSNVSKSLSGPTIDIGETGHARS